MCERCEKKALRPPLPPERVEESLREIEQALAALEPEVRHACDQFFFAFTKMVGPLFPHHDPTTRTIAYIALLDRMARMGRFLIYPEVHAGLDALLAKQPPVGNHDLVTASQHGAFVAVMEAPEPLPEPTPDRKLVN